MIEDATAFLALRPETTREWLVEHGGMFFRFSDANELMTDRDRANVIRAYTLALRFTDRCMLSVHNTATREVMSWMEFMDEFGVDRVARVAVMFGLHGVDIHSEDARRAILSAAMDDDTLVTFLSDALDSVKDWSSGRGVLFTEVAEDGDLELLRNIPAHVKGLAAMLDGAVALRIADQLPAERAAEVDDLLYFLADGELMQDVLLRGFDITTVLNMWRSCAAYNLSDALRIMERVPAEHMAELSAILNNDDVLTDWLVDMIQQRGPNAVFDTWRFCVEAELPAGFFVQMVVSA